MSILDLVKATLVCGGSSFLIYAVPVVSQVLLIGVLAALWTGYLYKTLSGLRRRG